MNTSWQLRIMWLTVFMLLCAALLTLVPAAQGYNPSQEMEPQKVFASFSGPLPIDPSRDFSEMMYPVINGWPNLEIKLEVWNVGSAGGSQYAPATMVIRIPIGVPNTDQFTGYKEIITQGTFTGGPNGVVSMPVKWCMTHMEPYTVFHEGECNTAYWCSSTQDELHFVDGQKVTYDSHFHCVHPGGQPFDHTMGVVELTVENPEAFETVGPDCTTNITLPQGIKPGEALSPSASFSDPQGKDVTPIQSRWYINGVETNSVIWDGKEVKIEIQYTCPNHKGYSETVVFPAYSGVIPPAQPPAQPQGQPGDTGPSQSQGQPASDVSQPPTQSDSTAATVATGLLIAGIGVIAGVGGVASIALSAKGGAAGKPVSQATSPEQVKPAREKMTPEERQQLQNQIKALEQQVQTLKKEEVEWRWAQRWTYDLHEKMVTNYQSNASKVMFKLGMQLEEAGEYLAAGHAKVAFTALKKFVNTVAGIVTEPPPSNATDAQILEHQRKKNRLLSGKLEEARKIRYQKHREAIDTGKKIEEIKKRINDVILVPYH